ARLARKLREGRRGCDAPPEESKREDDARPICAAADRPAARDLTQPMQFGIFDYIDDRGEVLQKTYEDRLALLQAAEAAGFYRYHLTEHHATPLSMTPSPSIFLAAAARETRRIRFGTLLYL